MLANRVRMAKKEEIGGGYYPLDFGGHVTDSRLRHVYSVGGYKAEDLEPYLPIYFELILNPESSISENYVNFGFIQGRREWFQKIFFAIDGTDTTSGNPITGFDNMATMQGGLVQIFSRPGMNPVATNYGGTVILRRNNANGEIIASWDFSPE